MLKCTDVVFDYGQRRALDGVGFLAHAGEMIGFFGHNGSGKSTLLKLLGGSLPLRHGRVELEGRPMLGSDGYPRSYVRYLLGILFQGTSSDDKLSSIDNLRYSAMLMGIHHREIGPRIRAVLSTAGLSERAQDPLKKLSTGMRRRLEVYRTFMHRPRILLLDEPTASLDAKEADHFFSFLKAYQDETCALVLISSHRPEELARCHRVVFMDRGRILAVQPPREVIASLDYVHCTFGVDREDQLPSHLKGCLFDVNLDDEKGLIRGKVRTREVDGLFKDRVMGLPWIRSFSMAQANIEDAYQDLLKSEHLER